MTAEERLLRARRLATVLEQAHYGLPEGARELKDFNEAAVDVAREICRDIDAAIAVVGNLTQPVPDVRQAGAR